jgi:hypothetical protein
VATTSVLYLALDPNYDPVFDLGAALSGTEAVAQNVLTRLKLFKGEWWENLNLGLPMFQDILGQAASSKGLLAMQLAVQTVILGTPYVISISSMQVQFNETTLQLQITATVQTAFGQTTITNQPGASASVGG